MIANILVILLLLVIAFLWGTTGKGRGFFSSFLSMVCVVAAGAIAFAVWEPVVYGLLLGLGRGGGFMENIAWGVGLLGPFLIALVILRLAVDQIVRSNVDMDDALNFVGGAACGAVSAIICVGILMISLGFFRLGPSMLGHQHIEEDGGSLIVRKNLWVPVDQLTAMFYEHLSTAGFASGRPLATELPNVHEQAAMSRMLYVRDTDDGTRMTRLNMQPDDFRVLGTYYIDGDRGSLLEGLRVVYPDDTAPQAGRLFTVFTEITSQAAEESGQVVVGPGQVRLVCKPQNQPDALAVHPVAMIAKAEANGPLVRFRMDADGIFIPSTGAASRHIYGFEFYIPPNVEPRSIIIKNVRASLRGVPQTGPLAGTAAREDALRAGTLLEPFGIESARNLVANLDTSGARTLQGDARGNFRGLEINSRLPERFTINRSDRGGLRITDDDNEITGGEHKFDERTLDNRGLDKKLRVERFAATSDTAVLRMELVWDNQYTAFGQAVERAGRSEKPLLVSDSGATFEAVGYVYQEGDTVQIRYTPDDPIQSLGDMPTLSTSKRDQNLVLIFRVSEGSSIVSFVLAGEDEAKLAVSLEPAMQI